jgi:hypothetical protein
MDQTLRSCTVSIQQLLDGALHFIFSTANFKSEVVPHCNSTSTGVEFLAETHLPEMVKLLP